MKLLRLPLLLALALLVGCSASPYKDGYPAQDEWVVLPILSPQDDEYGIQTERMLKVLLASKGIRNVVLPPESDIQGSNPVLSETHRLKSAEAWAKQHGKQLGMGGTVDYAQIDGDNRFRIGLTLRLVNLQKDQELWSISGESEGRPGEESVPVIRVLLVNLLDRLPLSQPSPTAASAGSAATAQMLIPAPVI